MLMIPEWRKVQGLVYGAHESRVGYAGYYVRGEDFGPWLFARLTPAANELPGDGSDEEILDAYREASEEHIAAAIAAIELVEDADADADADDDDFDAESAVAARAVTETLHWTWDFTSWSAAAQSLRKMLS